VPITRYRSDAPTTEQRSSRKATTLAGYGITDAATDAELAAHEADTTAVHGIANTANLALTNSANTFAASTPNVFVNTAQAAETQGLYLDNRGALAGTAVGIRFRTATNGSAPIADMVAALRAGPVGDLTFRVRTTAGGTMTDALVLTSSGSGRFSGEVEIDGALNHDGTTVGFYGVTPVARAAAISSPTGGATIDAEARTAIDAIRTALTNIGITS
jgi:hypothetical protein